MDINTYEKLKLCLDLNVELHCSPLVLDTFGNLSQRIDDNSFCIKPSGIDPRELSVEDIPVINIDTGKKVSGKLKPSSDTPTHLELYKAFKNIGGIVHTHSLYATAYAQAGQKIENIGTTHADYWKNAIPVSRALLEAEVVNAYEKNTGLVIKETLENLNESITTCPGILVKHHGPFTWGTDARRALKHAELLEYVAQLYSLTNAIQVRCDMPDFLKEIHFQRKHGVNSYYGQ